MSDEVGRMSIALPCITHDNAGIIAAADRPRLQLDAGVGLGTGGRQSVEASLCRQHTHRGVAAGRGRV